MRKILLGKLCLLQGSLLTLHITLRKYLKALLVRPFVPEELKALNVLRMKLLALLRVHFLKSLGPHLEISFGAILPPRV